MKSLGLLLCLATLCAVFAYCHAGGCTVGQKWTCPRCASDQEITCSYDPCDGSGVTCGCQKKPFVPFGGAGFGKK